MIKLLPCKIKSNFQNTFSYSNFWGSLSSYNTCKYALFWSSSSIYAWSIRHKFGQNIHKNWAQSNSVHIMAWKLNSKFQFQLKSERFLKKTKNFTKLFGQAWHQIVLQFSFSLILLGALEINFKNFDRFQTFKYLTFGLSSYFVKLNQIFKKHFWLFQFLR